MNPVYSVDPDYEILYRSTMLMLKRVLNERPSIDRVYSAWHAIGADAAGLDWRKFVDALQDYQEPAATFQYGDHVRKKSGSAWQGRVVGTYSTTLTPEGYAVESEFHPGSTQIYPASALELVP